MRILLVEDDVHISRFVTEGLKEEGHVVDAATDGDNGLFLALNHDYDLVILDLMLPKCDGADILRRMRAQGTTTPVVVLTARDGVVEKVRLLDEGADDYMTKPFSFSELSARLRALFRRTYSTTQSVLSIADLELDLVTRRVSRAGKVIGLTAKEFSLLHFFLMNESRVLTRRIISEHVWEEQFESFSNVIDVHVNRLRRKIDRDFDPKLIHTIRGVGYVFRVQG